MKREIKFRGKRVDNGEWVYGDLIHTTKDFKKRVQIIDWSTNEITVEIDPKTVGQFTGLLDKNGIKIYEGDIVIEKSYPMYSNGLCNYRCVVVWYEEEAGFGLEMCVVSNRVRGCAVPDSISKYTELEVIGTIYDNPEMLEL